MRLSRRLLRTGWLSATSASAGDIGILQLEQVSGVSEGPVTLPYNTPGTPLLDHFFYRDVNDDQHLKTMTALPRVQAGTGVIDVAFSDAIANTQFEYRIAHQRVSATGLSQASFTDVCRGQCTRTIARPAGDFVFVIKGFKFRYTTSDHHMDAIGILENNGQLTHWFNDTNDDDEYSVQIDYAWVPRSRFSSVPTLSGTVVGAGSASRTVPAGEKVIRGFHVNNTGVNGGEDNHVKRFGFLTNSTTVDVYYGDKDPADSADWTYQLRYAILN